MFDVWIGEIDITNLVLLSSLALFLPARLLLCFKVKSRILRLLPIIIFSLLEIIFIALSLVITGWDALVYIVFALLVGVLILMCGIGWGIWAIEKFIKRKNEQR